AHVAGEPFHAHDVGARLARVPEQHGGFVRTGSVPDPCDLRRSLYIDRGAVDVTGTVARRHTENHGEDCRGEGDRAIADHAISLRGRGSISTAEPRSERFHHADTGRT